MGLALGCLVLLSTARGRRRCASHRWSAPRLAAAPAGAVRTCWSGRSASVLLFETRAADPEPRLTDSARPHRMSSRGITARPVSSRLVACCSPSGTTRGPATTQAPPPWAGKPRPRASLRPPSACRAAQKFALCTSRPALATTTPRPSPVRPPCPSSVPRFQLIEGAPINRAPLAGQVCSLLRLVVACSAHSFSLANRCGARSRLCSLGRQATVSPHNACLLHGPAHQAKG